MDPANNEFVDYISHLPPIMSDKEKVDIQTLWRQVRTFMQEKGISFVTYPRSYERNKAMQKQVRRPAWGITRLGVTKEETITILFPVNKMNLNEKFLYNPIWDIHDLCRITHLINTGVSSVVDYAAFLHTRTAEVAERLMDTMVIQVMPPYSQEFASLPTCELVTANLTYDPPAGVVLWDQSPAVEK